MSHKKFGPDRFIRFDVYWIQTDRQTDKKTKPNLYIDCVNVVDVLLLTLHGKPEVLVQSPAVSLNFKTIFHSLNADFFDFFYFLLLFNMPCLYQSLGADISYIIKLFAFIHV